MEHFTHYGILFFGLLVTLLFLVRTNFIKVSFLVILITVLLSHTLLLHFDHQFYNSLSENSHQCCIIPSLVITYTAIVLFGLVLQKESLVFKEKPLTFQIFHSYTSRPPPFS